MGPTPVAAHGLGGLIRDHFVHGRLFATVGHHGGLLNVSYWGHQHLGAAEFFHGDIGTGWIKLFRPCIGFHEKRYYLTLNNTELFPFGTRSRCEEKGVSFEHELLLLPDALVQRFRVLKNPKHLPVFIEMFHQERFTATNRPNRTWSDFEYDARHNAIIASCLDENPVVYRGGTELHSKGYQLELRDAPQVTTWIGVGCNTPMKARFAHKRTKIYLTSEPIKGKDVSFFVVFAASRPELEQRLQELSKKVSRECDQLIDGYEKRLQGRPHIDVGNPILNSAFAQFPEIIEHIKVPDRPGAVRGAANQYFVWGWDGLTPVMSSALANEAAYSSAILRFFQETLNPTYGIPHSFTTAFQLKYKGPFPSQAQFIASLYHYIAITGDISLAREVLPTCKYILDRCRERIIKDTGLVSGNALWPDYPEVMEEDGNDISSMNNSLVYQGLRAMEYIAGVLGDAELSNECRDWAKRLRVNFVKYLYDEEHGYFISSCSSIDFKPRKHYCCQAVFWLTPFARELVSHAPQRIASFMNKHLRSEKCLLSLPTWDSVWMGDGNQLGSSYPVADYLYLNINKLVGEGKAAKAWLGDVEWFWKYHTAPEAFTPETENEYELGPDNTGGKQTQALSSWYACLYMGVAGLDFDHEGITVTPWGDTPVDIRGLRLRGFSLDLKITGRGPYVASLKLNGKLLAAGSRKIAWKEFKGKKMRLELVRSEKVPTHPVIVRADGLSVALLESKSSRLVARVSGKMTGEVVIRTTARAKGIVDGIPIKPLFQAETSTISIPFEKAENMVVEITS